MFTNKLKFNLNDVVVSIFIQLINQSKNDKLRHTLRSAIKLVHKKKNMFKGMRIIVKENLKPQRLEVVNKAVSLNVYRTALKTNGTVLGKTVIFLILAVQKIFN